jgi:enoyl-CoA hydratase
MSSLIEAVALWTILMERKMYCHGVARHMAEMIVVDNKEGYSVIRLNRPEVMNALSFELVDAIAKALETLDTDGRCKAVIITGNERAFAAGADIKQMQTKSTVSFIKENNFSVWDGIQRFRKPLIAAIEGYALGGGFELAMLCDIIVASESAVLGQPEINLGIMPGAGGTQRLTRTAGKYVASYYILTGERMSARDAERFGLVSLIAPQGKALQEAERIAGMIASKSLPSLLAAKLSINSALETALSGGLAFERYLFYSLFSTHDQKEGMTSFAEKRKPVFTDD